MSVACTRIELMFERARFSGLPGPALAAELAAADPHRLDDDALAAYLQAAKRLEGWADSLLARGITAFAGQHVAGEAVHAGGDRQPGQPPERKVAGMARPVRFGGEGTPVLDEFAADALAPVLRVAPMTAGAMLGDALDLAHRLPWVRTGLRDGTVSWSMARAIAAGTRDLTCAQLDQAAVDRRLYTSATRLTPGRLRPRIAEVVAQADPDSLDDAANKAKQKLYVGFAAQPRQHTTSIFGELDPTGALRLDQQLTAVARLLRRLDRDASWEALRAKALTLLADPAALRRLQRQTGAGEDADHSNCAADATGSGEPRRPATVVHLHADPRTWQSGDGLVEVEGHGWVPLWSLAEMLDQTYVSVVASTTEHAHPNGVSNSSHSPDPGYEPRNSTREAVVGRDRTCRFPGCNRRARACQCDHTIPWPHGPTCACNLGCLCTRHHRLKTHTRWRLRQPWPGVFLWRSPRGRYWLVDQAGTTELKLGDAISRA